MIAWMEKLRVKNTCPLSLQFFGHRLHDLNPGGSDAPVLQKPACDGFAGLLPDLTEILFQSKRPGNPFLPVWLVLGPVNSGFRTFSGEVRYERAGAGLA